MIAKRVALVLRPTLEGLVLGDLVLGYLVLADLVPEQSQVPQDHQADHSRLE